MNSDYYYDSDNYYYPTLILISLLVYNTDDAGRTPYMPCVAEGSKDHSVTAIVTLRNQLAHVSNLYHNFINVANTRRK